MTPFELALCVALVLFSGYISSSEIALFSLSRFQLRSIKEHLRPSVYQNIKRLLADPGGLLVTMLVINEVLNVSLSAIITNVIARTPHSSSGPFLAALDGLLPAWALHSLFGTLITAPIVLLACEITPKVIGARANQLIASLTAESLSLLYNTFKPVRLLLGWLLTSLFRLKKHTRPEGNQSGKKEEILRESDFLLMLEEGHREGAIREKELGLIKKVFELDDTPVLEIMKPLGEVLTISSQTSVKQALQLIRNQKYSRIPVVSNTRRIIGILYSKDLLKPKLDPELLALNVTAIMRKALFVSPALRLSSLFRKLKQERTHMAIILSESGAPQGIVTMSDVLSTLFEDVFDEEIDEEIAPRGSK